MGNNLLSDSTSKYILNDRNLDMLEQRVLELSEVNMNRIKRLNIPVGEYKNEPIYMRTTICGDRSK